MLRGEAKFVNASSSGCEIVGCRIRGGPDDSTELITARARILIWQDDMGNKAQTPAV